MCLYSHSARSYAAMTERVRCRRDARTAPRPTVQNRHKFQNATGGFTARPTRSTIPRDKSYSSYSRYKSSFLDVCYEFQRACPVPAWAYVFTYSL